MATVYVNDTPVDIGTKKLNCVDAAGLAGVLVPHYCYHPALSIVASCRMCLVEVGDLKDGKVTMGPKVVPGCQTPVKDGTVIVTGDYAAKPGVTPLAYDPAYKPGDKARKTQADTLEGLLLNHPLDCPVCDKAGECKLQDYSYAFGRSESRMVDVKNAPANKPHISSKITLFTDRCILCSRCVRFTREVSGTAELTVVSRGHHSEIDVFPGRPLENRLSGNVVDLCPVGALGSKDFLYTQRVWYLQAHDGVCSRCSTGCSTHTDVNKNIVYRLRARENQDAQGYFICDDGRWGYHFNNAADRLRRPTVAGVPTAWSDVVPRLKADLTAAAATGLTVALSPFLTVEEAYYYASAFAGLGGEVRLVLGPAPVVGADDQYPKDVRGNPAGPAKFIIRAEKCPNRVGVERVLTHFAGTVAHLKDTPPAAALAFVGGYPDPAHATFGLPAGFAAGTTLFVQDLFASGLAAGAKYVVPATTAFEKDGTFVNHAGLAQTFPRATTPPKEARTELQLAADLLGRRGLVQPAAVRKELAAVLAGFEHLAVERPAKAGKRLELAMA